MFSLSCYLTVQSGFPNTNNVIWKQLPQFKPKFKVIQSVWFPCSRSLPTHSRTRFRFTFTHFSISSAPTSPSLRKRRRWRSLSSAVRPADEAWRSLNDYHCRRRQKHATRISLFPASFVFTFPYFW